MKQGRRYKSSFCIIDGHLSFEECRDKTPKIQRSSWTVRGHCEKMILDLMQYSLNKDLQHLK